MPDRTNDGDPTRDERMQAVLQLLLEGRSVEANVVESLLIACLEDGDFDAAEVESALDEAIDYHERIRDTLESLTAERDPK